MTRHTAQAVLTLAPRNTHRGLAGLALVLAAGACANLASAGQADPDDLPVSRITLYRSGVGSFVREGVVQGDADVQLRFRTDQINDILKSMVVLDLDGGQVEGATYGSKEPLSRRLASFAVDISDNPGRAQLLDRLRGARVAIRTAEGEQQGSVLGVEFRESYHPVHGTPIMEDTVTLVTDSGIWSSRVDNVLSFRILDEALAAELNKALLALAEHRADNVKTLDLNFRGNGQRDVMVGYVHETPVWKTSYRLVLPEEAGDDLTLQGWAIVENTTEEDWEDVRLSLVSGQPISFTMDLYEPVYVARPDVPVPTAAGARPRSYAGGQSPFQDNQADMAADRRTRGGLLEKALESSQGGGDGRFSFAVPGAETATRAGELQNGFASLRSTVAAAASGETVGEVFQFTLDAPVTVGRQQSAMLPIIAGDIEGRRVSIFNQNDGLTHPMRGVEVTNDTGLQLMPGPIAVYDGTSYAGDAQIGHVSRSDERLLAYAVDLDVDARVEPDVTTSVQKLSIVRGMLRQQMIEQNGAIYHFESNDQFRGRTIVVEHPKYNGWDLVDSPDPEEVSGDLYRFEIDLDPGAKGALSVTQRRTRYEMVALLNYDVSTLMRFSRDGKVSQAVIDAFREAQRLQTRVRDSERTLEQLNTERNEIAQDQNRIRSNMGSIDRNSELYSRYMQKLTEQETRLEQIADAVQSTVAERDARQQQLQEYLNNLNVE